MPEGATTRLVWKADKDVSDGRPVRFLTSGCVSVDGAALMQRLASFVGSVVDRLRDQGVSDTPLTTEWASIQAADSEESDFCLAAALGLDPYSEAREHADDIVQNAEQIRTGRSSMTVRLRVVQDSDLDALFDHQDDPGAAEMAAFPSRTREQFDAHWAKLRANDAVVTRTILADDTVAGNIGGWQDDGQWTVGYWIGRAYWGQGVATQGLQQFVDELPHRPVYAHVVAHNIGSIRVLEKCGFEQEVAQTPADGIEELTYVLK